MPRLRIVLKYMHKKNGSNHSARQAEKRLSTDSTVCLCLVQFDTVVFQTLPDTNSKEHWLSQKVVSFTGCNIDLIKILQIKQSCLYGFKVVHVWWTQFRSRRK